MYRALACHDHIAWLSSVCCVLVALRKLASLLAPPAKKRGTDMLEGEGPELMILHVVVMRALPSGGGEKGAVGECRVIKVRRCHRPVTAVFWLDFFRQRPAKIRGSVYPAVEHGNTFSPSLASRIPLIDRCIVAHSLIPEGLSRDDHKIHERTQGV